MFKTIMVPVDLAHADRLSDAIGVARDLATRYGAKLVFVGVTATTPGPVAHNPEEFAQKLAAFAKEAGGEADATSHVIVSHDPTADMDDKLVDAIPEIGADLVVMATHVPGIADMLVPSHGGSLARHVGISVFLVRSAG